MAAVDTPSPDPAPGGARRYGRARLLGLVTGPLVLGLLLAAPCPEGLSPEGKRVAGAAALMAIWWITEAIPIPVTALVPLALFPLLGAAPVKRVAAPYAHPLVFLFLGGFLLALAMQRWGLHRRIALHIIGRMGSRPSALVAGFMASAALLSMWVSNTATAMMMLPIGLSVIDLAGESGRPPGPRDPFALALLLGIAYSCSIGGLGTLVGTPPNAFFAAFLAESQGIEVGFAQWMEIGLPMVLIGVPLAFWTLTRIVFPLGGEQLPGGPELLAREREALGPMSRPEKMVAVIFVLTAVAWILRPLLGRWIHGLSDPGIAITAALLLFVAPLDLRQGRFLLDWDEARRIPWGVLLLLGGGLSLAAAIQGSGLAAWLAGALQGLAAWPTPLIVMASTSVILGLTEVTSNTATAAAFLPILASVAEGIGRDPLLLVVPGVLAASCAFMLPVATPPNAIIYAGGRVTIPQMVRAGLLLEILFVVLITGVAFTLVPLVFGVQTG